MAVLLTRPLAESQALAREISDMGLKTVIAPLTEIIPVAAQLPDFKKFDALVFTSANGVRAFAAATGFRDKPVYAVGDATASVARDNGFSDVRSCGGTIDEVNKRLTADKTGVVLHIRGVHAAGAVRAPSETLVLYDAVAVKTLSDVCIESLKSGQIESVLFFSPRAGKIFTDIVKAGGLESVVKPIKALCLSHQVLDSVKGLPWAKIRVAAAPEKAKILDLLKA